MLQSRCPHPRYDGPGRLLEGLEPIVWLRQACPAHRLTARRHIPEEIWQDIVPKWIAAPPRRRSGIGLMSAIATELAGACRHLD